MVPPFVVIREMTGQACTFAIRKTTGGAAAPTARYRKLRRGNFIKSLRGADPIGTGTNRLVPFLRSRKWQYRLLAQTGSWNAAYECRVAKTRDVYRATK